MAVKALFAVTGYEPETDGTWRAYLHIWSGANSVVNQINDSYFSGTTLASTVNAALHGFVEGYIQAEWSVEFNPLTDSVKMLNPVSLV
jgi:hypothetical protein